MHKRTIFSIIAGCLLGGIAPGQTQDTELWYDKPVPVQAQSLPWAPEGYREPARGNVWERLTLPVGNGRIGATGYSGTSVDMLTLNEISLWTGGANTPKNGKDYNYGPLADKDSFGCYQPFANLVVQYDLATPTKDYKRRLNLNKGMLTTEFKDGNDNKHYRESFVSQPDDVMVYHAQAEQPQSLSAKVALLPFHTVEYRVVSADTLCMRGTLANGERFEGRVQVRVDGGSFSIKKKNTTLKVDYSGGGDNQTPTFNAGDVPYISISGANNFTLLISLATNYKMDPSSDWKGQDPAKRNERVLAALKKKSLNDIRRTHQADFGALFNRVQLNLGKTAPELAACPTNVRLDHYRKSQNDPELEATVYQYGRYVLISGSRPGNLPVNLQGIWNNKVHPAWACDYHNNINLQMCYWGAEVGNLSECHLPLIDFINTMQQPLAVSTRRQFGNVRGWTTRISQNPWGAGGWVKWNPPVNAWYALHVWDHYAFTQDKTYLKNVAYPILKNICNFWEDSLKKIGKNGEGLISDGKPLTVREHPELAEIKEGTLVAPSGWSHEWGPIEDGCAHDQQLIRELFDITIQAASILKVDAEFVKTLKDKRAHLAEDRIGSGGYLQEWIVDRPNMVSGHRHTSHLIGVYPGSTISPALTPELAEAAMKSLELRGLSGDNRRSWTWPWRTALWARFGKADKAYDMVKNYLIHNTLDNLFGNHPPMQMDGTYGMTGGISEMLVQSHAGRIELLPALPEAWKDGQARGLRARGNITIDMAWKDGKVSELNLKTSSRSAKPVKVLKNGELITIKPTFFSPDADTSAPLPTEA